MIRFKVQVFSHGLKIRPLSQTDRGLLQEFAKELTVFDERFVPGRGMVRQAKQVFATYHPKSSSFGIHRGHLKPLLEFLERRGVSRKDVSVVIEDVEYMSASNSLTINAGVEPRGRQPEIIDFLCKEISTRVLPAQTGLGKTFMALYASAMMGKRTACVMGAMHIDTWKKDVGWIMEGGAEENVRIVKGGSKMRKLIKEAQDGTLTDNIIFFSVNTIRDYLTDFEKNGKSSYGCDPIDFYKTLGVGLRITDEAHENLHFNFRHDIETNVSQAIYLSATLKSNDAFVNKLYDTIYPPTLRFKGLVWNKYIDASGLGYGLNEPAKVKYKGPGGRYNHIVYEDWIRADVKRTRAYFDMIARILEVGYIKDCQPGMTSAIFFSSVAMCDDAEAYFKERYPDKKVSAYTGVHEDVVLHSNDIICTTIGSCGTGKDIKGLKCVILTTALSAREKNIQVLGRLRDLENQFAGVTPLFYYLVCRDIKKHMDYHRNKVELFSDFAKTVRTVNTNFSI